MAYYSTLTHKQLAKLPDSEIGYLSAAAYSRLPADRIERYEQTNKPWEKALAIHQQYQQELDAIVMAFADGELDYHRLEIELYRATGISVDRLLELRVPDFWAYARAELNRRNPWVAVAVADCAVGRSTLSRHADDPTRPDIKAAERGKYLIRQSSVEKYVKPERLEAYRK
jgi:hypothetical protein